MAPQILAKGPTDHPFFVNKNNPSGGTGVDWSFPESMTVEAYNYGDGSGFLRVSTSVSTPTDTCNWNGISISQDVRARAIAKYGEEVLAYGLGNCEEINFDEFLIPFPALGELLSFEVYLEWMGTQLSGEVSRVVVQEPLNPPTCTLTHETTENQYEIHFIATADDVDGDPLTYSWDIDGTIIDGGLEQYYNFGEPGTFWAYFYVSDGTHEPVECMNVVEVE